MKVPHDWKIAQQRLKAADLMMKKAKKAKGAMRRGYIVGARMFTFQALLRIDAVKMQNELNP